MPERNARSMICYKKPQHRVLPRRLLSHPRRLLDQLEHRIRVPFNLVQEED